MYPVQCGFSSSWGDELEDFGTGIDSKRRPELLWGVKTTVSSQKKIFRDLWKLPNGDLVISKHCCFDLAYLYHLLTCRLLRSRTWRAACGSSAAIGHWANESVTWATLRCWRRPGRPCFGLSSWKIGVLLHLQGTFIQKSDLDGFGLSLIMFNWHFLTTYIFRGSPSPK